MTKQLHDLDLNLTIELDDDLIYPQPLSGGAHPMSEPLREFAEHVEQACDRAMARIERHDYVFNRFPRDMKKEPPVGDGERWEAMAFALYNDICGLASKATQAMSEADDLAALSASGAGEDGSPQTFAPSNSRPVARLDPRYPEAPRVAPVGDGARQDLSRSDHQLAPSAAERTED